jgi:TonB family protein
VGGNGILVKIFMDTHHLTKNTSYQISQCHRWLTAVALVLLGGLAVPIARAVTETPVPVRTSAPEYPFQLKRDGVSGVVTVKFSVDEKGNVVDPEVLKSSNKGFEQAALNANLKWKFKPALQDGAPVKSKLAIPLQFSLGSDQPIRAGSDVSWRRGQ